MSVILIEFFLFWKWRRGFFLHSIFISWVLKELQTRSVTLSGMSFFMKCVLFAVGRLSKGGGQVSGLVEEELIVTSQRQQPRSY